MHPLLEEFKNFCEEYGGHSAPGFDILEDLHWYDMSIGWFIARGAAIEDAETLALEARYDYHYWLPE